MKRATLTISLLSIFALWSFSANEEVKSKRLVDYGKTADGWSSWTPLEDCFAGIDFMAKNNGFGWDVKFRNRYKKKIHFAFQVVELERKSEIRESGRTTNRTSLKAGSSDVISHYSTVKSSSIYVFVNKVRLGDSDTGEFMACYK